MGQFSLWLAFMMAASMYCFLKRRSEIAGVLLGLTMFVKFFGWPFAIYFLIKKDWRALASMCATFCSLHILNILIIGVDIYYYYFSVVINQVQQIYVFCSWNLSIFTLGQKLFLASTSLCIPDMPEILTQSVPGLIIVFNLAVFVFLLLVGIRIAYMTLSISVNFPIFICFSVMASPIVWAHSFSCCFLLIVTYIKFQNEGVLSNTQKLIALLLMALLYLGNTLQAVLPSNPSNLVTALMLPVSLLPLIVLLANYLLIAFIVFKETSKDPVV